MNRLFWIRHGEDQANVKKIFSHRKIDFPLTEKGVMQARQTAAYLSGEEFSGMYSSPMKRALQTAEIIAREVDLKVQVMENFREVNVGELDGKPMRDEMFSMHQEIISDWFSGVSDSRFPGGENYRELLARMKEGILRVFENLDSAYVVVVAHGGSFKYVLKDLCNNVGSEQIRDTPIPNCSISELEIICLDNQIEGELISLGDSAHLHGAAAKLVPGLPSERTKREETE